MRLLYRAARAVAASVAAVRVTVAGPRPGAAAAASTARQRPARQRRALRPDPIFRVGLRTPAQPEYYRDSG